MAIVFITEQSRTIGSSYKPEPEHATVQTKLEAYLSTMQPMQSGKTRKALENQQGFSGKVYRRHEYAERIALDPNVSVDYAKGRIVLCERGTFYEIKHVTKAFADYLAWLKSQA